MPFEGLPIGDYFVRFRFNGMTLNVKTSIVEEGDKLKLPLSYFPVNREVLFSVYNSEGNIVEYNEESFTHNLFSCYIQLSFVNSPIDYEDDNTGGGVDLGDINYYNSVQEGFASGDTLFALNAGNDDGLPQGALFVNNS